MINEKRLIDLFISFVETSSESGKEGKFRDLLITEFARRGINAKEDKAGEILGGDSGNLLVYIPGTINATPLLFSAHLDTVKPGEDIKAVVQEGLIKSVGPTILGADDKAAIAAIIEAYDVLIENNLDYPPLELLFTVSEEQGLKGAKAFDYSKIQAKMGYVLDGGGSPGNIILKSPAQNEIKFHIYGKAAHAGINPEDGINAINLAAKALASLPFGRIDEETTINFGLISGGKASNIVADYCYLLGEVRSLDKIKLDNITDKMVSTFTNSVTEQGGRVEAKVTLLYPEINLNPKDEVVTIVTHAAQNIGLTPILTNTGGGSDASIINGQGINCANLGIGMQNVHTIDEFISIEDLVNDTKLILAIIAEYIRHKGA